MQLVVQDRGDAMTFYRSTLFAVMILLLPASSESADSTSTSPPNITGCYELSTMNWDPPPVQDIKYVLLPKTIWLTSTRAFREGAYVLLPAPGQPQTFHNLTYWEKDSKEGILLRWAAGPGQVGVRIILQLPSDPGKPIKGVAKASFDTEKPYKDLEITATKVSCRVDFPE
jgi:hypothetical protein